MSGASRRLLKTEGESGRFEFKRDGDAVTVDHLVAAANAVALERVTSGHITILVGVDEAADQRTGLVTGKVVGVANIERERGRIQSRAANTLPVPVAVTIIEENTETQEPFLRVEVRPTRAPHYTEAGRRVTRDGAGTRAITDDELVELYLHREAEAFSARFTDVASSLEDSLAEVAGFVADRFHSLSEDLDAQLDRIDSMIDDLGTDVQHRFEEIHDLAATTAGETEEGRALTEDVMDAVYELPTRAEFERGIGAVIDGVDVVKERVLLRLRDSRQYVWGRFKTWVRRQDTKAAADVAERISNSLSAPISLDDLEGNLAELQAWPSRMREIEPESAAAWNRVLDAVSSDRERGWPRITPKNEFEEALAKWFSEERSR